MKCSIPIPNHFSCGGDRIIKSTFFFSDSLAALAHYVITFEPIRGEHARLSNAELDFIRMGSIFFWLCCHKVKMLLALAAFAMAC